MWQKADVGELMETASRSGHTAEPTWADEPYREALGSIRAKVLLMPCKADQFFTPEESEVEALHLKHAELAPIDSVWGHIAGTGINPKDTIWMSYRIRDFLET